MAEIAEFGTVEKIATVYNKHGQWIKSGIDKPEDVKPSQTSLVKHT